MSIKHWPATERPREKLLQKGVVALSDAELLAILLRVGCAGSSAVDNARTLLQQFGSLKAVMQAPQTELTQCKGMGEAAYCQFAVVLEIGKRVLLEQHSKTSIRQASDLSLLLRQHLAHETVEVLLAVFLDSNSQLIAVQEISRGSLSHHTVYARELAKLALRFHAAAVILAHNHPSGCVQPSREDLTNTQYLQDALALLDISLIDHVIVSDQQILSVWQA